MIKNARIVSATITKAEHGVMTVFLVLTYKGEGQQFGGYALDGPYNNELKRREANRALGYFLARVMEVLEVDTWEKVAGLPVRVNADANEVVGIGNFLSENWFYPAKELEDLAELKIKG